MAYPSVTYSFINGNTADAPSVNQNFTDLVNGISDGTKDINVAAITCTTLSTTGNVVLGDASADTCTINAALTVGGSGSSQTTTINGNALNMTASSGNAVIFTPTGKVTSAATQYRLASNFNDGSNSRELVRFNVSSTTGVATTTGGRLDISTVTTAGSLTTAFSIDNTQAITLGPSSGGVTHRFNTNTATTATTGAATLPANPVGFWTLNLNGTDRKIPYYAT